MDGRRDELIRDQSCEKSVEGGFVRIDYQCDGERSIASIVQTDDVPGVPTTPSSMPVAGSRLPARAPRQVMVVGEDLRENGRVDRNRKFSASAAILGLGGTFGGHTRHFRPQEHSQ